MTDTELTTLAAELRTLRAQVDEATARAAFAQHTVGLSPEQIARLAALVGFGSANQFGAVTMGDVVGGDVQKGGVNIGGQATIYGPVVGDNPGTVTVNYTYTHKEHQRRLADYLALLRRLAEAEAKQPLAETPDDLAVTTLRHTMARAALRWPLPLPAPHEALDDLTRRSLVAALLLPLVTNPSQVLDPSAQRALSLLASPRVTALVEYLCLPYLGRITALRDDELLLLRDTLIRNLANPQCAEGCARLLADLATSEGGQRAVATVWSQYAPSLEGQSGQVPAALQLFAAGVFTDEAWATGSFLAVLAVLQRLGSDDTRTPTVDAAPSAEQPEASARTDLRWRIPVTRAEWQAEVERRNARFGEPAGYWCYVRPGTYRIGGWERDQAHADLDLDAFWIARVPVTVAQYAAFIEAGGYRESRWWTTNGWNWRREAKRSQPWRWREAPFNQRERQAVTGVTWYEAAAFCRWLDAGLPLPSGYTVRLPTEAEWEAAAAYDAAWRRRTYPWGEAAPTAREAVFGRKWEEASPDVATCLAGAAACGALDVVGTVWEWTTSSEQVYPKRAHWLKEDFTTDVWDVPLRGGSYWNNSTDVRCGARYRAHPVGGLGNYLGVRVCLAPRSR